MTNVKDYKKEYKDLYLPKTTPTIVNVGEMQFAKKTDIRYEKIILKYGSDLKLYPISNSQAILVNDDEVKVDNK
jgi:hypothetical protein